MTIQDAEYLEYSTFDESILDGIPFLELRDLYIKVKTAYYSSLDFKNRF